MYCLSATLVCVVGDRFVCCIVLQRTDGDIKKELRRTARIARNQKFVSSAPLKVQPIVFRFVVHCGFL